MGIIDWLRPSSRSSERSPTAPTEIPSSHSADGTAAPENRRESTTGPMKRKTDAEEHGTNTPKKLASASPKGKKDGSQVEQPLPVTDQHTQQKYEQRVLSLEAEIDNLKREKVQQEDEKLALKCEIADLKSALAAGSDEHQRQNQKAQQDLQEYRRRELSLETDISNLKQTIEQYRGDKISLTREVITLKGTLASATEEHRRQRRKADEEFRRRESLLQDNLRKSTAAAQQTNHQLRNLHQDAQRRESSLRSEIGRLEWELAQLQAKNAEHKDKVELAHRAAKAIMNKIRSFDTSDTDAEVWFQSRGQSWYTFSRANAHPNTNAMMARLEDQDIPELCQALSGFVALEEPGQELPNKLLSQKGTPQLLLHALLANFIFDNVIWSPFWFLDAIPVDDDQFALPIQTNMENLYQYLMSLHESDAHQWRSSLARILAVNGLDQPVPKSKPGKPTPLLPGTSSSSSSSDTTGSKLLAHRREYAQNLAHLFLSGPARFLMRDQHQHQPVDTTTTGAANNPTIQSPRTTRSSRPSSIHHPSLARLTDEIDEALRFSIKIWSGRSNIEKMGLEDFQKEPFNGRFITSEFEQSGNGMAGTTRKTPLPASSSSSMSLTAADGQPQGGGGGGSGRRSSRSVVAFGVGADDSERRNVGGASYMELYRGCGEAEACNGQKILVVVQPGIAAVGTEEGEGYDDWKARRVWTRAQVFV